MPFHPSIPIFDASSLVCSILIKISWPFVDQVSAQRALPLAEEMATLVATVTEVSNTIRNQADRNHLVPPIRPHTRRVTDVFQDPMEATPREDSVTSFCSPLLLDAGSWVSRGSVVTCLAALLVAGARSGEYLSAPEE